MSRVRYFEFHDETSNSHKFYRVTFFASGNARIEWGRVGTTGQSQTKTGSEAEAKINEKISKGYREVEISSAGAAAALDAANARARIAAKRAARIESASSVFLDEINQLVANESPRKTGGQK